MLYNLYKLVQQETSIDSTVFLPVILDVSPPRFCDRFGGTDWTPRSMNPSDPRNPSDPSRSGDESRPTRPDPASCPDPAIHDAGAAGAMLADLEQQLNRLQRSIRNAIQTELASLTGKSLESLEHNQQLVGSIHQLLDGHGLRVQCSECGHPAILRVSPRAGIANGAFVFDHSIDGRRTFHGGRAVMPAMRLVAKPARRKSAPSKKRAG
jgi:hypothetical protein